MKRKETNGKYKRKLKWENNKIVTSKKKNNNRLKKIEQNELYIC